jgi:hypothetical protein
MTILGFLPYSELAVEADLAGKSTFDVAPDMVEAARTIKVRLDELEGLKGQ